MYKFSGVRVHHFLEILREVRPHNDYEALNKWRTLEHMVLEPALAREDLSEATCLRTVHTKGSKMKGRCGFPNGEDGEGVKETSSMVRRRCVQ